jgi:hypothetical protein
MLRRYAILVGFLLSFTTTAFSSAVKTRKLIQDLFLAAAHPTETQRAAEIKLSLRNHRGAIASLLRNPDSLSEITNVLGWNKADADDLDKAAFDMAQKVVALAQTRLGGQAANVIANRPELFDSIPDQWINQLVNSVRSNVKGYKISEHPSARNLFDEEHGIADSNPENNILIRKYLPKYFDNLSVEEKLKIAAAVVGAGDSRHKVDQTKAFVLALPPLPQKLFQLFAKDFKSQEMVQALLEVQHSIPPIPLNQMQPVLDSNLPPGFRTKIKELRVLGSGTIGQVYLATLKGSSKFVLKVLRPGILESISRDEEIFKRIVDDPTILQVVLKMTSQIKSEADFLREARNTKDGAVYLDLKRGISVVKLYEDVPPTSSLLALELAPGQALAKIDYNKMDIDALQTLYSRLLRLQHVWFARSLFGGAIYHGDLHPGNIFFDSEIESSTAYLVTMIDFGNASRLEVLERQTFVKIAASVFAKSADGLIKTFEQLHPEGTIENEAELHRNFSQILMSDQKLSEKISAVFRTGIMANIPITENMVAYNRGRTFIEKELRDVAETLNQRGIPVKYEPVEVYRAETLKAVFRAFPWPNSTVRALLSSYLYGICHRVRENI